MRLRFLYTGILLRWSCQLFGKLHVNV
jgi:hypothetical protein